MSMIAVPDDPGLRAPLGRTPIAENYAEALPGAAMRQANSVVSILSAIHNSGAFESVDGYTALPDIKGTPYFDSHSDRFVASTSPAETESIKRRIDQEEADRKVLHAAGGLGVIASMVAGTLDPTMLLPGRVAFGVAKEGGAFLRGAREVGAAMGVQATVQEGALQASQETRTPGESVMNVASATVLGALLGGTAVSLLAREGRFEPTVTALDRDRAEMAAHANPEPMKPTPEPVVAAPPLIPEAGEKIRAATVEFEGKIYEGANHAIAIDQLEKQLGRRVEDISDEALKSGFITTAGRVVSREEALRIVKAEGQYAPEQVTRFPNDVPSTVKGLVAEEGNFAGAQSTVGAATTDTRTLQPVSAFGLEKLPTDPMSRLINSPSVSARRAAVDLAEPTGRFEGNLEGIPTTQGPSLDRLVKLATNQTKVAAGDKLDELWKSLRFDGAEAPWFAKARDAMGTLDRPPELPNFDQFKRLVSDALRNGDVHDIPQVQEAARFLRAKVFDPWKERAIKAGLLPEDVDVKTADSYLQRVYNKASIAAQRPEFVNTVMNWMTGDQAAKAGAKDRLSGYSRQLEMAEKRIADLEKKAEGLAEGDKARADLEYDIRRAGDARDAIRANVEAEIKGWEGQSSRPAKAALRTRAKAEEGRAPDLPRLRSADPEIDAAVRRIIESDRDLSPAELRDRAHQITERILGSPDGRLPYDEAMGGPQVGYRTGGEAPRGPLAAREFNIPDAMIGKWLENDIEHIVNSHLRTMVPDVLLAERFGDTAMTEAFRKIEDDFARLIDATKNERERTKLDKQRQAAIRDLAAMRDRIRGVYGLDQFNTMRGAARVAQAVKNYNVLSSMGMATVSSLPDMAGAVFRHGLGNVFSDAWAPFTRYLMGGGDEWKQAAKQFRAMGIATESVIAQRHHAMNDIMENFRPNSRLERTLQVGADKFQFANLLAPWTDWGKVNASMVAGAELLRAAKAATERTATKKQIASLAESGIDGHLAEKIWSEFSREGAGEVVNGVHLPNTDRWQSRSARDAFEGAVGREADIAIVTPGQEKPLWLSNPIISVIGQFKSFTAAATQRILIANLQRADAQTLQGLIFSMGLGMMSYKLNSVLGGQPTSDKPGDWIKEAMSRGSLFGWFEEGNALASKMTRGRVDMYRLVGTDKPLSRYAGRSVLDQILGPTAGKVEALAQVTGAAAARDWKESDTKAVHKLTAFGNLFWLRNAFNAVEVGANNAFGVPMKAPTQH